MRDETSPFFDYALRGSLAGLLGAGVAFATYCVRFRDHQNLDDVMTVLGIEVVSFCVVTAALIVGTAGLLRERTGRSWAVVIACLALTPPAVAFASGHFGTYAIPTVDGWVVGGGLSATFIGGVRTLCREPRLHRIVMGVFLGTLPVALLALPVAWAVEPVFRSLMHELWLEISVDRSAAGPGLARLGALGGLLLGPVCSAWLLLSIRAAELSRPAVRRSRAHFSPKPSANDHSRMSTSHAETSAR